MLRKIRHRLNERFTNVWVLLSDTDRFVSRAGLMKQYEKQLRDWRLMIQESRKDIDRIREIRDEIIRFRRCRREEGWELRLGSLDVQLKGFRSDDAMNVGFQRMVLILEKSGAVQYIVGSGNHIQLEHNLQQKLRQADHLELQGVHYLWYRRTEGVLELAGADSELRESYEELKIYIEKNKSSMIKALYKLP